MFDAVVIGGGPSGASAAYHLARGGAKVALVERHSPRGESGPLVLLGALAQDCLHGMGLAEWALEHGCTAPLVLHGPGGGQVTVPETALPRPPLLVPREGLRLALLEAAAGRGVQLFCPAEALAIRNEQGRARVALRQGAIEARLALLAEGSGGWFSSALGLANAGPQCTALLVLGSAPGMPAAAQYFFLPGILPSPAFLLTASGAFAAGLFAHGNRAVARGAERLPSLLEQFGLQSAQAPSHLPLRTSFGGTREYAERLLVVGDAAQLAHPLTQLGIGPALESGRIAAQHALYALEKGRFAAKDLSAYRRALRWRFGVEYRLASFARAMLHSGRVLDRLIGRAERDEAFARMLAGIIAGTQSVAGALTPATLSRYLTWWRAPGRRRRT